MLKNAIFVVNPISGGSDKASLSETVRRYAAEHQISLVDFETTGKSDEQKLLQLYKDQQPERVIVAGGDGTIKMVAEALEQQDVILGIIPAGSANGLSVDLKFPDALEEQLDIAFGNSFIDLDMVCINDKKSLHLSDIGLNAELIANYENGSIRGKIGYAINAISTLTDEPVLFQASIQANGNTLATEAKMVVIANAQKYGTGVTINPLGSMDDGKFEIVVLKTMTLGLFAKIIAGKMPLDSEDVEIISTDRAVIKTDIPVHFQVDGEYLGEETELNIHILPGQMKVAVPKA